MGFGKSVQQQQRRSLAADTGENAPGFGVDPFGGKAGKQVGEIGHFHTFTTGAAAYWIPACAG
jgi:hypothetical protein